MEVAVSAIGSRGDVVPFAHLAARFTAAGHHVTLVTHESSADVLPHGVRVVPVDSDPQTLMAGPAGEAAHRWRPRELNRSRDLFADFLDSGYEPAREALQGADVLVASTFSIAAVHAALELGVPVVRPKITETTALGAAYLAGLAVGYWQSTDEIAQQWQEDKRFEPQMEAAERERLMKRWKKAVERSRAWEEE